MRPSVISALVVCAIPLLSGCSTASDWLRKPTKYKQIPENFQDPHVGIISMDATRRVVTGMLLTPERQAELGRYRLICSEPPPDVATSIASEGLLEASTKTGESARLGTAYQALITALAARSPKVENWRTTSSTYCNLLMNGQHEQAMLYLSAGLQVTISSSDTAVTPTQQTAMNSLLADILKSAGSSRDNSNAEGSTPAVPAEATPPPIGTPTPTPTPEPPPEEG